MMGSRIHEAINKDLLPRGSYPSWMKSCVHYEVITGSVAYGISDDTSDMDIYGWCIPPKRILFPYAENNLFGFDEPEVFRQFQKHGVVDPSANAGKGQSYDFTIFNIVDFCKKCMECNPNMLDALFVPRRCILHSSSIAEMIRQNRDLFLSKKAFHKFTGYLHSQMSKLDRQPIGKRKELVERMGFDTKYASHAVRLACQVEQVLELGTMDITRDRELYKAIRRGEWSLEQIRNWVAQKELQLNKLYNESKLRHTPEKNKIRELLLACIEQHYGSFTAAEYTESNKYKNVVQQIEDLIQGVK